MPQTKTAPALQLDLPGAPATPHRVPGVPGLYRPDRPTPVDGPGEATAEQARDLDGQPGTPLKLVRVNDRDLDELRAAHHADIRAEGRQLDPAVPSNDAEPAAVETVDNDQAVESAKEA